ncbi:MAG: hypothetical protein HC804_14505 [Anaerolineae bacterium]|nr:hypothetical protein [Anaerolineae bacterium]
MDAGCTGRPSAAAHPYNPSSTAPLITLLPGAEMIETAVGQTLITDKVYPLHHQHGRTTLSTLLNYQPASVMPFTRDGRFQPLDFRHFLFLDTETTGLAGASTIAFMVGVAYFAEDALVVRQYFVPDFGDEAAMLTLLDELLADKAGLITFNGRTFDIPLLDTRYLMNRQVSQLRQLPHLDLLPPARRLWRARLGSVALSALEPPLLGVHRTEEDVPGWLIPGLYHDYLRTGNGRDLLRVFYHNQIDMLSMVTLAARVAQLFSQPQADDDAVDLFSLGRWQASLGQTDIAEQCLRWAAQGDLPLDLYHQNLAELGWLLKRHGRHTEALSLWQQIAATSFDDVSAHIELAKYYEWQEKDTTQAIFWTEQALKLTQSWPPTQAALTRPELEHRLTRLQNKQ